MYSLDNFDDSNYATISTDTRLSIGLLASATDTKPPPTKRNAIKDYTITLPQFPDKTNDDEFCLFTVLDNTVTKPGRRKLFDWIQAPLKNLAIIKARQEMVALFSENSDLVEQIQRLLKTNCPDLARTGLKIQSSQIRYLLKNLHSAKVGLAVLPTLLETIEDSGLSELVENQTFKSQISGPLATLSTDIEGFIKLVDNAVDFEHFLLTREYRVAASASETLKEIKKEEDEVKRKIENYFRQIKEENFAGIDKKLLKAVITLKYEETTVTIRVTKKARTQYSKQLSSFTEISSKNAEHLYTTSALSNLSSRWQELQESYTETSESMLLELKQLSTDYSDILFSVSDILSELDCILSLAKVVINSSGNYVLPKLSDSPETTFNISQARHPVLDNISNDVIPNDIRFDNTRMIIITGPNMGGKSTYIKMVALLSVMAQIGSFIPADDCQSMPLVDKILARIGANDQPQYGVSTFMSEMMETSNILRQSTKNSLVIIDELGRGTSTYDGFGLACAVASELVERQTFCLQATHFHEMSRLENDFPGKVKNYRVGVFEENENVTFTYQLEAGVSKGSYGINCAKLAGIPDDVVKNASRYADQLENISQSILELEPSTIEKMKAIVDSEISDEEKKIKILTSLNEHQKALFIS